MKLSNEALMQEARKKFPNLSDEAALTALAREYENNIQGSREIEQEKLENYYAIYSILRHLHSAPSQSIALFA